MASATVTDAHSFPAQAFPAQAFPTQALPGRAVVRVTGEGVLPFLHNLLTCDLTRPVPAYGALLSPQGKILHDLFVIPDGQQVWLDVARPQAEALLKSLALYRLRAKLDLALVEGTSVGASSKPDLPGTCYADPRTPTMGYRSVSPQGLHEAAGSYDAARLRLGLGDSIADIGSGVLFPHEANLDQLNGVSFRKGCYVGQEVVSRMHHRHTARNRLLPVRLGAEVAPGTAVMNGDTRVGEMCSNNAGNGIALLRLDRLADARGPLLADGNRVHVQKPDWGQFDLIIPEDAA